MLRKIVFSVFCVFALTGMAQEGNNQNDPGFIIGVFDAPSMNEQLNRKSCDGIRFYNALVNDTVRVMAVSIEKQSDMRSGWFPARPYIAAMRVNRSGIVVEKLKESEAEKACEFVEQSSYSHYSAHFRKTDLLILMGKDGCNALKIVPINKNGTLSMEVHAVENRDGTVTDIGQGTGFDLICTDPCPPVCGSMQNYVYRPR